MKRYIKLLLFFAFSFFPVTMFPSIDRCRVDSILGAVRNIQCDSSKILGKVCTILEKVCDLQSSLTFNVTVTGIEEILEKVCDIDYNINSRESMYNSRYRYSNIN